MSLKIVGDMAGAQCKSLGGDKTGNHLIVFENGDGEQFGKCNKCSFYIAPKDFDATKVKKVDTKSPEYVKAQMDELNDCPFKALPVRKVSSSVAERYGLRSGLDQVHGDIEVPVHDRRPQRGSPTIDIGVDGITGRQKELERFHFALNSAHHHVVPARAGITELFEPAKGLVLGHTELSSDDHSRRFDHHPGIDLGARRRRVFVAVVRGAAGSALR